MITATQAISLTDKLIKAKIPKATALELLDYVDNQQGNLATEQDIELVKQDIKTVETELKQDIKTVKAELKQDIKTVKAELKQDIKAVKTELKQDIKTVETELKQDIKTVETELKQDIHAVKTELKQDIQLVKSDIRWLKWVVGGVLLVLVVGFVRNTIFPLQNDTINRINNLETGMNTRMERIEKLILQKQ